MPTSASGRISRVARHRSTLPQQVAADSREFLGIWDHLQYLEQREQVIEIHQLADGEIVEIGGVRVRPLRLAQDFVYAFLFEEGDKRLLVVMDELTSCGSAGGSAGR